jgi:endoglucanase
MRRRAAAAAEIFRLTGAKRWHEAFVDSLDSSKLAEEPRWEEREAAWIYARIDRPEADAELKMRCRELIVDNADFALDHINRTAFGWAKKAPDFPVIGCLSAPIYGPALIRAHVLTGDSRYLMGAIRACQTGLGANPLNLCYTTRMGYRWPVHRFNLDILARIAGPPDGWCPPGPMDMKYLGSDEYFRREDQWVYGLVKQYAHPDLAEWPAMESYFDVFWLYPMHEGMVQGGVSCNAYTWGYLASCDHTGKAADQRTHD